MNTSHHNQAYLSFNRAANCWQIVAPRGHSVIVVSTWKRLTDAAAACDEYNFPGSTFKSVGAL